VKPLHLFLCEAHWRISDAATPGFLTLTGLFRLPGIQVKDSSTGLLHVLPEGVSMNPRELRFAGLAEGGAP